MEKNNSCSWPKNDPLMIAYHDTEWGVPLHDDANYLNSWCWMLSRQD